MCCLETFGLNHSLTICCIILIMTIILTIIIILSRLLSSGRQVVLHLLQLPLHVGHRFVVSAFIRFTWLDVGLSFIVTASFGLVSNGRCDRGDVF